MRKFANFFMINFFLIFLTSSLHAQDALIPIDEKFWVKDVDDLSVNVMDADVSVNTKSGSTISVQVLLDDQNSDIAMRYFENQNFSVSLDKTTLVVATNPDQTHKVYYDWHHSPDINVIITMPPDIPVNLRTLDGNFEVNELIAGAKIRTSDGDIVLGSVSGDRITIQTLDGNIEAQSLTSPFVSLRTSDGDISIETVSGESIAMQTLDGDIEAMSLKSPSISLKTSDGDLNLGILDGESIELQTIDGDVFIELAVGRTNIRTSDGDVILGELLSSGSKMQMIDGDIRIDQVSGHVSLTTSDGDVFLGLIEPEDVAISVIDGDITLTMIEDLSVTLDISGSYVTMDELPQFSGKISDTKIEGDLNGGGTLIRARTSDGDVIVKK